MFHISLHGCCHNYFPVRSQPIELSGVVRIKIQKAIKNADIRCSVCCSKIGLTVEICACFVLSN